ncbi:MAG TPA: BamA/TamA family outer membrane protein [Gammaproteobacteria bacterium]|nr:BamA/TamA family outer membrane protein [Gammaproteobacteria bacterium]
MRRIVAGGIGGALLGAWMLLAPPALADDEAAEGGAEPSPGADDPAPLPREELERRGATIRAIDIVVDNVFDPSKPDENKRLYRWANRVHMRTHTSVIDDMLLFDVGDTFDGRLLDESARALRARGFLADAALEPRAYDPATNTVEVEVHVRDSWTLAPDLKLSRSGGENEFAIGLSDENLLGTGKSLTVKYSSDVDRDETLLGYNDGNVMGRRVRLNAVIANASDGHRRTASAERPFFSFDTRWSLGGGVSDVERVNSMYDLGEVVDEFRHEQRSLTIQGGVSRGLVNRRARRWLFGVTHEEDRFAPTPDKPQPLVLPLDRELVYPWMGVQIVEDDYREMTELNDMGRTEDVALGLNLLATLGVAKKSFGSDRDALLLRASAQMGWEPGAGRLLLFNGGGWARDERDGLHNAVAYAGVRYYQRNLEKLLFSVTLEGLTSHELDAENQILLGGDNGLRGYPLRYQAGEGRAILNVEQRFFTDWYPWRLFRVGYAAFFDAGKVWGKDPRATNPLGTLYDVGIGLRLSSPRASGRSVVHIDLAFPLNGDPSIDNVQLVVETKGSF